MCVHIWRGAAWTGLAGILSSTGHVRSGVTSDLVEWYESTKRRLCGPSGGRTVRKGEPRTGRPGCPSVRGWAQGENEITAGSLLGDGANEYIVHLNLMKLRHLFRGIEGWNQ